MGGEQTPSAGDTDPLDALDRAAAHVLEARALLMRLPRGTREDLRARTDALLLALGRRIAAELPPSALRAEGPCPGAAEPGSPHGAAS